MLSPNFEKLERDRQQIWLLHLQPGEFHEPISATLSLAYLGDHPKYEALSYIWGDRKVRFDITVDGETVPVTINLWAALRRLRGLNEDRVLWVDALCINQEDEARNHLKCG
ncbi:heterokaryon incompatibility protein-domain-containing protein [Diaporthe sp. PMI_573]|nr:heterokaryon incompatibility protein-domain-containing protein [Diaporthaceae sp. PMI_573]